MSQSETGVMGIKKKVATLKAELDEAVDRATIAEAALREKDTMLDKVSRRAAFQATTLHSC